MWSVDFCPYDSNLLATGARDGMVKIWKIADNGENETSTSEICKFEPFSKQKDKKVIPVTAVAFAPSPVDNNAILAIGLESGLIELWSFNLNSDGEIKAIFLQVLYPNNCHIEAVKKLSWRPRSLDETSCMCLASCSLDHGVRIHEVRVKAQDK